MVLGAVIALFKHDLKALLAFSTVSHLGLITMLLGTGTAFGALAAMFHILNHATFKAALFMSAGIIDHEAHTRDIRRLGGLRTLMPITFVIATIGALSMAGIPFLNGFLSKEMMLEEAYHTVLFDNHWLVPALAVFGSLFSAAYCFRLIKHTFLGPVRHDYPSKPHDPPSGLWLPPAFLIVLVVGIGVAPFLVEPFVKLVAKRCDWRRLRDARCPFQNLARSGSSVVHVHRRRRWRPRGSGDLSPIAKRVGCSAPARSQGHFRRPDRGRRRHRPPHHSFNA
jgi:multicomponent K+:H+ antiporter subunit A